MQDLIKKIQEKGVSSDLSFWKKIKRQPKLLMAILLLPIVIIFGVIVFISLGFDQKYFGANIIGNVTDMEGNPLSNMQITVQDQSVLSDVTGKFVIKELKYGVYPLKITGNGYEDFVQEVKLERFDNILTFKLNALEFGELELKMDFVDAFYADQFEIKINDQPLTIDQNYTVSTGKLLIGNYVLKLKSPYYKDFEMTLNILPGFYKQAITLTSTADLRATSFDLLTGKSVIADEVLLQIEDQDFVPVAAKSLSENQILLKDLELDKKVALRIVATDFKVYNKEITLTQGLNDLGKLSLVPAGRLVSVSYVANTSTIRHTNLNGGNSQTILTQNGKCQIVDNVNFNTLIDCPTAFYQIKSDKQSAQISGTYLKTGQFSAVDQYRNSLLVVDNLQTNRLVSLNNNVVLYNGSDTLTSVIAQSEWIVFTTEDAVWKVKPDGSDLQKVTDGIFELISSNDGTQSILMYNQVDSKQRHIWLLDLLSASKRRLSFLADDYQNLHFLSGTEVIYSRPFGSAHSLYKHNLDSSSPSVIVSNIQKAVPIDDFKVILIGKPNGSWQLYSNITGNLVSLK